ncbi:ankyrin repeat-containing protein BDA1-like protein [Cinnamomum micranthum f. kanehirae]|uniref:Ankyrin repeat-containing protein BDA1-like protein n=1 Tax=Cinnamomum micranthum f. kanehirae TaxID=337451 RepID=A0A443NGP7_9MAGN|nr:ankyrin repeat-containing protein BDA1-like protein [Cinnamomum micranthum f. kanehirae]
MEGRLFQVCEKGDTLTFQKLYDTDNSVLQQRAPGSLDTPLHLASRSKHKELASMILRLQPNMAMATNNKGETPLHEACRVGEMKIVKQLLDACPCVAYMLNLAKESALYIACCFGYSEVASELCKRMNFRAWDEIGASCLRIAASEGYTDILRKIVRENPSLASRKDESGCSALHLASRKGNVELIKEFLGKDPNLSFLRDCDGRSPLHSAVISEQLLAVQEFLVERPGPASFNRLQVTDLINIADNNGDTVLHLAASIPCLEIIEILLSRHEMKVNAANKEGMTALDILQQIPAQEDPNVRNDCYRKRVTIIQQLKARKRANPTSVTAMQQALIVVVGLILAITYHTGLNPPGGFWQNSDIGNDGRNHRPGKAIQSETAPWLFTVFLASDSLGFIVSLALIPILMMLRKEMVVYVNSLVVVALISIEVAFILGLIMISDHKIFYRVEIFLLVLVTLAGIWWTRRMLKLSFMCLRTDSGGT